MTNILDKESFFDIIANKDLSETDLAIYFIWYSIYSSDDIDSVSLSQILKLFKESRIRGALNPTRLKNKLTSDKRCIFDLGTFQLQRGFEKQADIEFGLITDTPHQPNAEVITQVFSHKSNYYTELSREINSGYESRNFNSCAVIMRRMVESLIIDIYLTKGLQSEIKNNGEFVMLEALIGKISSGHNFELSRDTKRSLLKIKEIGDKASHNRSYILKKVDVDDVALKFRSLIHELSQLLI